MAQKINVSLNFTKPHLEIAKDAVTVYEGLKDNPNFPNLPVPLDAFTAMIDAYITAIANAADASKKAIVERNKLKESLIAMERKLGHWVEANCQQDLGIFKSSGFQAASTVRVPQGPLPRPVILKTDSGTTSGEILAQITALPKARSYELRYTAIGADGKPGAWTLVPPYAKSRNMSVTGLTPGTAYTFQARALGRLGYTDWSDAANRISV